MFRLSSVIALTLVYVVGATPWYETEDLLTTRDAGVQCDNYLWVSSKFNKLYRRGNYAAEFRRITADRHVTKRELLQLLRSSCRVAAEKANELLEMLKDCENIDEITESFRSIGNVCNRRGRISSYALRQIDAFTIVALDDDCTDSSKIDKVDKCSKKITPRYTNTDYSKDVLERSRLFKEEQKCILKLYIKTSTDTCVSPWDEAVMYMLFRMIQFPAPGLTLQRRGFY